MAALFELERQLTNSFRDIDICKILNQRNIVEALQFVGKEVTPGCILSSLLFTENLKLNSVELISSESRHGLCPVVFEWHIGEKPKKR